jgi:hypothetical protein
MARASKNYFCGMFTAKPCRVKLVAFLTVIGLGIYLWSLLDTQRMNLTYLGKFRP